MVAHARAGPRCTREGTIIDWNPVDKMYSIALDVGITVRARPRDVTVTNIQDLDPPVLFDRQRPAFADALERIVAEPEEEMEEEMDEEMEEEILVFGVAA